MLSYVVMCMVSSVYMYVLSTGNLKAVLLSCIANFLFLIFEHVAHMQSCKLAMT